MDIPSLQKKQHIWCLTSFVVLLQWRKKAFLDCSFSGAHVKFALES